MAEHTVKCVGEGKVSICGFLQLLKGMERKGGATHRAATYQGPVLEQGVYPQLCTETPFFRDK